MASIMNALGARHIQNMSEAASLEPHWGYADRAVPCTNDKGSCEYLDVVYHSHDLGIWYTGIFWATVGGILLLWGIGRRLLPSQQADQQLPLESEEQAQVGQSTVQRFKNSVSSYRRQYFLPEAFRPIFGRTTRLQVVILLTLTGYLTIWSFVGIVYKTWITPVKKMPGVHNTRTSLGPWSDRVGVLAYALTPLSVLLSQRESLLSLITGVPYQNFNFLHRWLGYIIFAQSSLHTIGWCVIELRLYQPQPSVGLMWIKQLYMIWGVIAMFLLLVLFLLSTPWAIRWFGYEFFRKAHYVLAMVYIGACWGHWAQLNCYLLPALLLWFIDRGIRLARTGLIHYNYISGSSMGFRSAPASITYFPDAENGDVIRLDFVHSQYAWAVGEHFYLCFPQISLWQSHPFTPLSLPGTRSDGQQRHSYILRAKKGATKVLADIASVACVPGANEKKSDNNVAPTTPVILSGPYGGSIVKDVLPQTNVLCIAGGTGITFVVPVLLNLINQQRSPDRKVELIWAVRRDSDMAWISQELDALRRASVLINLNVRVFVTRQNELDDVNLAGQSADAESKQVFTEDKMAISSASSSSEEDQKTTSPRSGSFSVHHTASVEGSSESRHPDLGGLVQQFVSSTVRSSTTVFASGPGSMISDLRKIIAKANSGDKVWKGIEKYNVKLVCDDRLEW
jgi:predicted ferric reductase